MVETLSGIVRRFSFRLVSVFPFIVLARGKVPFVRFGVSEICLVPFKSGGSIFWNFSCEMFSQIVFPFEIEVISFHCIHSRLV